MTEDIPYDRDLTFKCLSQFNVYLFKLIIEFFHTPIVSVHVAAGTQIECFAGDKIIFYTDGIVEAMNEQEEIYGFERLMEAVKGTEGLSAGELLDQVKASVDAFVGSAQQHDDLTVIVLSVDADQT